MIHKDVAIVHTLTVSRTEHLSIRSIIHHDRISINSKSATTYVTWIRRTTNDLRIQTSKNQESKAYFVDLINTKWHHTTYSHLLKSLIRRLRAGVDISNFYKCFNCSAQNSLSNFNKMYTMVYNNILLFCYDLLRRAFTKSVLPT